MSHPSEPDPKTWNSLKELFEFWQSLKNDVQEENSYLEAVKIEEIQLILYERLSALSRQIVYTMVRGPIPREEILEEVVNKAIYRMFNAYADIPDKDNLEGYFALIVRNLTRDRLNKINKEVAWFVPAEEEPAHRAADEKALQEFDALKEPDGPEDLVSYFEDKIFEIIDLEAQGLTDKEFVALAIKLASVRMRKKLTDEQLAQKLGMKRTAFRDALARGKTKIRNYWRGHIKNAR